MLANPRRGWQLEGIVRPLEVLITMCMTTLSRWLVGKLSKHSLELTPKLLAIHRRGWQQERMVRPVEGLINMFMATLSMWLDAELSNHWLELTP